MAEYMSMVEAFATFYGLQSPRCDYPETRSVDLGILSDNQLIFLYFLEACIVRFCRLWSPALQAFSPNAAEILDSVDFKTKKIGQFMQVLDRSSLINFHHVMIPWSRRCIDTKSMIVSVVASVTLAASPSAARVLLPLPHAGFAEALRDKMMTMEKSHCQFAYARSLIQLCKTMPCSGVQNECIHDNILSWRFGWLVVCFVWSEWFCLRKVAFNPCSFFEEERNISFGLERTFLLNHW